MPIHRMIFLNDGDIGKEPYVFDLTGVEEPRILKDFNPSENDKFIDEFVLGANGVFYFAASNGQEFSNNQVLWRSDGTDNGTWMVDFLADTQTDVGNRVLFRLYLIVVNSRGVPPANLTPFFADCACLDGVILHGAASFHVVATPMNGF